MSFIVLDTDVASTILRGRLADPLRSRLAGNSLCITFVTLGELTKWTVLRDWGPRRQAPEHAISYGDYRRGVRDVFSSSAHTPTWAARARIGWRFSHYPSCIRQLSQARKSRT